MDGSMKRRILAAMMAVALTFSLMACQQTESSRLKKLTDSNWKVREQAALALGQSKSPQAVDRLISIFQDEFEVPYVRRAAALSLGKIGDARGLEVLERYVMDQPTQWFIHWAAGEGLAEGGASSVEALLRCTNRLLGEIEKTGYQRQHYGYKRIIANSFQRIGPPAFERLAKVMKADDFRLRRAAIFVNWFGDEANKKYLFEALRDSDPEIRIYACKHLIMANEPLWFKATFRMLCELQEPNFQLAAFYYLSPALEIWPPSAAEKEEMLKALTENLSRDENQKIMKESAAIIAILDPDAWAREIIEMLNEKTALDFMTEILNFHPKKFSDKEITSQLIAAMLKFVEKEDNQQLWESVSSAIFDIDVELWAKTVAQKLDVSKQGEKRKRILSNIEANIKRNLSLRENNGNKLELKKLKEVLIKTATDDTDPNSRYLALKTLNYIDRQSATKLALKLVTSDPEAEVRYLAMSIIGSEWSPAKTLGLIGQEDLAEMIKKIIEKEKDDKIRTEALSLLLKVDRNLFLKKLEQEKPEVVSEVLTRNNLPEGIMSEVLKKGIWQRTVNYFLEQLVEKNDHPKENIINSLRKLNKIQSDPETNRTIITAIKKELGQPGCGHSWLFFAALNNCCDESITPEVIELFNQIYEKYKNDREIMSKIAEVKIDKQRRKEQNSGDDADCSSLVLQRVTEVLGKTKNRQATEPLIRLVQECFDRFIAVKKLYLELSGEGYNDSRRLERINKLEDEQIRLTGILATATQALKEIKDPQAIVVLEELLSRFYYNSKPVDNSALALAGMETENAQRTLFEALRGPNPLGRIAAAYNLSQSPDQKTTETLIKEAKEGNLEVVTGAFKFFFNDDEQRWETRLSEALDKYFDSLVDHYLFSDIDGEENINSRGLQPDLEGTFLKEIDSF